MSGRPLRGEGERYEKNASMGIEVSWILQRFGDLPIADAEHDPLVMLERCLPLPLAAAGCSRYHALVIGQQILWLASERAAGEILPLPITAKASCWPRRTPELRPVPGARHTSSSIKRTCGLSAHVHGRPGVSKACQKPLVSGGGRESNPSASSSPAHSF